MVPNLYRNLMNFEIMKMDKLMLPMLDTITWSSSGAMDVMSKVMMNFNYSETFIRTV